MSLIAVSNGRYNYEQLNMGNKRQNPLSDQGMDQMEEGNKEMKENMEVIMKQRGLRKLVSMILAVVMVLAMSAISFAANATIIIENSVTGKTYEAYKILDATSNGSAVSYTIDSSNNPWYSVIDNSNLFTLSQAGSTNVYYVTQTGTNDEVIKLINDNYSTVSDSVVATGTGNGGDLTLTVTDAGYYYVTTTSGSVITVNTAADSVTVVDKNQKPGGDLQKTVSDTKAEIGDTVTYTITSNVPAYDGTTKITNYTFTDTLDIGLTAPEESEVTVTIKDASGNKVNTGNAITVTVASNVITVSYDPTAITNYPADATISIVYTATVNALAAYENGNKVVQTWTDNSSGTNDEVKVYTYGFYLKKVDRKNTSTQLEGAEFHLTDGTNTLNFVYDTDSNTYTVVPAGTNGATTVITVGFAKIFGLDADETYYLYEDKAPNGYNLITGVAAAISVGQTKDDVAQYDAYGINSATTEVQNSAGSSLPSTGGIGTTIFYIVGGVLVLGAAVLFVTKRRLSNEN